jgi:GAF domain-containing protein
MSRLAARWTPAENAGTSEQVTKMNTDEHPVVAEARRRAMEMLEQGAPQREILPVLVAAAELASGGDTVSSILVLDKSGLLRNGASPKLPQDYLDAIDGLAPSPGVGTCAAAAATGQVVLTPDFRADHKWAELRHLPMALGYQGAWSQPIKTADGKVLGTFGTYFREIREPGADERRNVAALAATAAIVIDRGREPCHAG